MPPKLFNIIPANQQKQLQNFIKSGSKEPFKLNESDKIQSDEYLTFSFKFFDYSHPDFKISLFERKAEFEELLESLKGISKLTIKELLNDKQIQEIWHFHEVFFKHKAHLKSFNKILKKGNIKAQIIPCQFKAFSNNDNPLIPQCRLIGFLTDNNIFFIVWIDRNHKVYS